MYLFIFYFRTIEKNKKEVSLCMTSTSPAIDYAHPGSDDVEHNDDGSHQFRDEKQISMATDADMVKPTYRQHSQFTYMTSSHYHSNSEKNYGRETDSSNREYSYTATGQYTDSNASESSDKMDTNTSKNSEIEVRFGKSSLKKLRSSVKHMTVKNMAKRKFRK